MAVLEKDKAPLDFDTYSNLNVNIILKKLGYFTGMIIGKRAQGWNTFFLTQREDYKFKLGYQPTPEEVARTRGEAGPGRPLLGKGTKSTTL